MTPMKQYDTALSIVAFAATLLADREGDVSTSRTLGGVCASVSGSIHVLNDENEVYDGEGRRPVCTCASCGFSRYSLVVFSSLTARS